MKHKTKGIFALLTLSCFLITGCTAVDTDKQNNQETNTPIKQVVDSVYRVMPSGRTTSQWDNMYGVVSYHGEMIIPMDNHEVYLIYDTLSEEQLWIQTATRVVDDPTLSAEDLWKDDNWDKLHINYAIYDLEGNLIKELGENGIMTVCGNLVLHYNGQLVDKNTGALYYDDVNTLRVAGEYYAMNTKGYDQVRILDKDLHVVYETDGGFIGDENQLYISAEIKQEDGNRVRGLQRLDGTELVPYGYDYFNFSVVNDAPYIVASKNSIESVISLEDGTVVYREDSDNPEYDYIQYFLKDCMVIQKREVVATAENGGWPIYAYFSQLYAYDGTPIGERYRSLYPCTEANSAALAKDGEAEMLFYATKTNGEEVIINQAGEVIYKIPDNGWISVLRNDRIIESFYNTNTAALYDAEGNQLTEKPYTYIYTMYVESASGDYINSSLLNASYELAGKTIYDVLDMDGTILLERVKGVQVLSEDRFWVEKGFYQGLMDREGNWIYKESVFDSAVDE